MDIVSYILSRKYTEESLIGGGAVKGKNCTIDSIETIEGGHRITFKWTLDDGTVETDYIDVMDGITNEVVLSKARYDLLSEAEKMNGTTYYVYDED
jgi:hypothetical protein